MKSTNIQTRLGLQRSHQTSYAGRARPDQLAVLDKEHPDSKAYALTLSSLKTVPTQWI